MQETGNNQNNLSLKSIRFTSDGFYVFEGSNKPKYHSINKIFQLSEPEISSILGEKLADEKNLSFYIPSNCFTVVPTLFVQHDKISEILTFDKGQLPANHVILSEKNLKFNYTTIYTIPLPIYNAVRNNFANAHFHFSTSVFQSENSNCFQVWVGEENSTFRVVQKDNLLLFNNLAAKTEEDLLFYVLKIAEDFDLSFTLDFRVEIFQPNQLLREEAFTPYLSSCSFISQEDVL